jgi:hypothetical protein
MTNDEAVKLYEMIMSDDTELHHLAANMLEVELPLLGDYLFLWYETIIPLLISKLSLMMIGRGHTIWIRAITEVGERKFTYIKSQQYEIASKWRNVEKNLTYLYEQECKREEEKRAGKSP